MRSPLVAITLSVALLACRDVATAPHSPLGPDGDGPAYDLTIPGWPAPPSGLTLTVLSASTISLAWIDNASTETGFHIERCTGALCLDFAGIDTVGANVIAYQDTSPTPNTSYRYRVRARNASGYSSYSEVKTATTPPALLALASPVNLRAVVVSASQIDLAWDIGSGVQLDYYHLERCTGAGCTNFVEISKAGSSYEAYSNRSLTPGTWYSYRVVLGDATGHRSGYSNVANARTMTLPAAPTGLAANALSSSRVYLSWTDNSSDETSFFLERCVGATCGSFTQIAVLNASLRNHTDIGLPSAGTVFRYRLRARSAAGYSAYSNVDDATTLTTVSAPLALTATAVGSSQVNLSWTDDANNETGFSIERCAGTLCNNLVTVATTGKDVEQKVFVDLAPSTAYRFRVRASNATETSLPSNSAYTVTAAVPAAPSNLTATASTSGSVTLSWSDNATNEAGFVIERCSVGGIFCASFTVIDKVKPDVRSYVDVGLSALSTHKYRVRAHDASGDYSAYSNVVVVGVPAIPGPPKAPSNLTATAGSSSITIRWTDNALNERGVRIERCRKNLGEPICVSFVEVATVGANVTWYGDAGLPGMTSYVYRVRSFNDEGVSSYSNTVTATTALVTPWGGF